MRGATTRSSRAFRRGWILLSTCVVLAMGASVLSAAPSAQAAATVSLTTVSARYIDLTVTTPDVRTSTIQVTITSTATPADSWVLTSDALGPTTGTFTMRIDGRALGANPGCGKLFCIASLDSAPSRYSPNTYLPNDQYSVTVQYDTGSPGSPSLVSAQSSNFTTVFFMTPPVPSVTSTGATTASFSTTFPSGPRADATAPYANAPRFVFTGLGACALKSTTVIANSASVSTPFTLNVDYSAATTTWSSTGSNTVVAQSGSDNIVRGCSYSIKVLYQSVGRTSPPGSADYPFATATIASWTVPTVPDAPTITSVATGAGTATVTFAAPSYNGGAAITGYRVTAVPTSGATVTNSNATSPITLTGLVNGTQYSITVAAVNGAGTGAESAPVLATPTIPGPLTFSAAAFPAATVGMPTSVTVTVTNTGSAAATIGAVASVTGIGVSVTGGTCLPSAVVAPSATCTVVVGWTPVAVGALSDGSVTVPYAGGANPSDSFALSGTASAPVTTAGPLALSASAFPAATVGTMASLSTTVTNAGTSSVTLSGSPAVTGLGVTVVGGTCASGAVIAPAGTCTIVLGWTPQATGALADATVSFTHPDGPAASDVIALTGTASAAVRSIDSGAERTVRLTDPAPATTSSATAASCPATPALSALSGGRTIPLAGGKVVVRLAGFGATGKALSLRGSALILQAGGKLAVRVTGAKACSDVNVRVAATKGARAATQITSTLRVASSGAGGATVVLPGGLAAGGYTVVVTGAPATGAPWTAQAAAVVTGSKTGRSARH